MTKEQQDLIWVYLPKEVRNRIISVYFCKTDKSNTLSDYSKGYIDALVHTYGKHNLTSDTEPDEMLMVNRKKVQEYKAEADYNLVRTFSSERFREYWRGQQTALDKLFGNKCMPDKEESVQVEPKYKFSLGQKVILHFHGGEKATISERLPPQDGNVWNCYKVKELPYHLWLENELDPYTEPETKDNMEEKELNLAELLKGCEGTILYSRAYGDVSLNEIVRDDRPNAQEIKVYTPDPQSDRIWFLRNGRKHKNGEIDLWPSRALYEKYPLDAPQAWREWQASRKPKRWRAKEDEIYWYINAMGYVSVTNEYNTKTDDDCYNFGNYFRTKEEAQQAAEAVRECLEKFHEKKYRSKFDILTKSE